MAVPIRVSLARLCRDTRHALDITQRQLAEAVGVSPGYIARIELDRANPTAEVIDRIGVALGLEFELTSRPPLVVGNRQTDFVHARCSAYVDRRLHRAGWATAREVETVHGRWHGWIDILAFDPRTGRLLIVEVKTRLDDIGAIERQLSWYERSAWAAARGIGWRPTVVSSWLVALASDEVERSVLRNTDVLRQAFPVRSRQMLEILAGAANLPSGRGLALIDPTTRRDAWLIPTRSEGRRTNLAFVDYADTSRRLAR